MFSSPCVCLSVSNTTRRVTGGFSWSLGNGPEQSLLNFGRLGLGLAHRPVLYRIPFTVGTKTANRYPTANYPFSFSSRVYIRLLHKKTQVTIQAKSVTV